MHDVVAVDKEERTLEFILTLNEFRRHLGANREYRKIMEWLFRQHRERTLFIAPERSDITVLEEARKRPIPCQFTTGLSRTARPALLLVKIGGVCKGVAFNYESHPKPISDEYATSLWKLMQQVSPKRPEREPERV